jgi:hypothetical protein
MPARFVTTQRLITPKKLAIARLGSTWALWRFEKEMKGFQDRRGTQKENFITIMALQ